MNLRRPSLRARLALIALILALAAGGGLAVAQGASGDTSAVAVNTKDNSSVFKLAFQIRRVAGGTVDDQNAAVAYASCDACRTVAVSIQVLLISGDTSTFTPTNLAIAINQNCTMCDTLAFAYQFAVGIGTKLKFTAAGNQQLADIRRQLQELRNANLSDAELQTRLDGLMGQLSDVLNNDLVGVAEPAGGGADSSATGSQPQRQPSGTGTTPAQTTPQSGTPPAQTTPSDATATTPQSGGGTSTTPDGGTTTTPSGGSGTSTTPTPDSGSGTTTP
jgi:putative peptide zinc metalloprotease protein